MRRYTKEDKKRFIKLYRKVDCNATEACKLFRKGKKKMSRDTFQRWCREDEWFAGAIERANESLLDEIEDNMLKSSRGFEKDMVKTTTKTGPKGTEITITKQTLYFPPNVRAGEILLNAKGRHRGYGIKASDDIEEDDEDWDEEG